MAHTPLTKVENLVLGRGICFFAPFDAAGLPMGMQIIGPPKADLAVLKLGAAYDAATGWVAKRRPAAA